jgi:hypothetical protein
MRLHATITSCARAPATHADGSGLLGALSGRGKDFQLRAAAAHTVKVGRGYFALTVLPKLLLHCCTGVELSVPVLLGAACRRWRLVWAPAAQLAGMQLPPL